MQEENSFIIKTGCSSWHRCTAGETTNTVTCRIMTKSCPGVKSSKTVKMQTYTTLCTFLINFHVAHSTADRSWIAFNVMSNTIVSNISRTLVLKRFWVVDWQWQFHEYPACLGSYHKTHLIVRSQLPTAVYSACQVCGLVVYSSADTPMQSGPCVYKISKVYLVSCPSSGKQYQCIS